MSKPVCNNLAKAPDLDAYYRSYLTGDADKDKIILDILRERNRQREVQRLTAMMHDAVKPAEVTRK